MGAAPAPPGYLAWPTESHGTAALRGRAPGGDPAWRPGFRDTQLRPTVSDSPRPACMMMHADRTRGSAHRRGVPPGRGTVPRRGPAGHGGPAGPRGGRAGVRAARPGGPTATSGPPVSDSVQASAGVRVWHGVAPYHTSVAGQYQPRPF